MVDREIRVGLLKEANFSAKSLRFFDPRGMMGEKTRFSEVYFCRNHLKFMGLTRFFFVGIFLRLRKRGSDFWGVASCPLKLVGFAIFPKVCRHRGGGDRGWGQLNVQFCPHPYP